MVGRVRTQGTLNLILGIKKGIISTTKEIRNKYLKGGFYMDLTDYEIKVINMLFDSIFTIEKKKQILLETDSNLYIDFSLNGESPEKIYSLFDSAFELKHKIEIIIAFYKKYGFEFKDIHNLLENRNVIIFNYYDSSWRNKKRNRFNRYCYC